MLSLGLFSFFILISCCVHPVYLLSQYPIILIVSYDAFRFDYLSKGVNPVITKLRNEGTYSEYMDNVFVTKTFPNHHSIATGVYPEFHGILGNTVYDNYYKKQLNYSYEFWHYSDEILPIWIANEKKGEGRHSGIMMWPGNEYEYSGIKPTHQKAWSYNVTWEQRVDGVIEWILDPEKPANLVLLYIEEPDYHGHSFGADSPKLIEELKLMDKITKYLLDKLNENDLINHVNLFLLADHGMLSVTKKDVIDLRKIVSSELYDKYESSPAIHIYPKTGKATEVYDALKKAVSDGASFSVYKKSEIPDEWHFKNNRRTPPILAVADPPHVFHDFYPYIEDLQKRWNFTADDDTPFGIHGYDNKVKSMKPYFVATGPNIKQRFKIETFKTVDLFSLWAHMSGFPEYAVKTNGSLDVVSQMLRKPNEKNYNYLNIGSILLGVLLLSSVGIILIFFGCKNWRSQKKHFSRRLKQYNNELEEIRDMSAEEFEPFCSLSPDSFIGRFTKESAESRQRLLDSEEET